MNAKPLATPKSRPLVVIGKGSGSQAVATQFPMWGKGQPIYFWADHGLVWWEDMRDDVRPDQRFGSMKAKDALLRVQGISEMIIKSSEDRRWGEEKRVIQQFICDMEGVCRQALDQGNPMDNVDFAAERKRRRATTRMTPKLTMCDIPGF